MSELTIRLDRQAAEAVYEQIARQVRQLVMGGQLRPGAVLPPVRTFASDLGVSLNTVARAYRMLAEEGFVGIRQRARVEVLAPAPKAAGSVRTRLVEELEALVARMCQAGIPSGELSDLVARLSASPGNLCPGDRFPPQKGDPPCGSRPS